MVKANNSVIIVDEFSLIQPDSHVIHDVVARAQ
jgi:hypothetical protein